MEQEKTQSLTEYPLISILIITYNSSKYVLETLESSKAQTYKNIELIVSDDGSADDTVEICAKWLQENKLRFARTELLTVIKNTGISANCNRGLKSVRGEWVKAIAGDDILLENCLADNYNFIQSNPESEIVFSKPIRFGGDIESMQRSEDSYLKNEWVFSQTSSFQLQKELERVAFWYSATLFLKKTIWEKYKFDEKYANIEDIPFILKCLKSGHKLSYFPIETVKYRFGHSDSVQHTISNRKNFFYLYRDEFFVFDIKNKGALQAWDNYVSYYIRTKRSGFYKVLLLSSPFYIFNKISSVLGLQKNR